MVEEAKRVIRIEAWREKLRAQREEREGRKAVTKKTRSAAREEDRVSKYGAKTEEDADASSSSSSYHYYHRSPPTSVDAVNNNPLADAFEHALRLRRV